jgi:hypothetical protein
LILSHSVSIGPIPCDHSKRRKIIFLEAGSPTEVLYSHSFILGDIYFVNCFALWSIDFSMVNNVMTLAFKVDEEAAKGNSVDAQIAARQRALEEIDQAKFGWYHLRYRPIDVLELIQRAIMVAGSGFFTDAYDIFSINMGMSMELAGLISSQYFTWIRLLSGCNK